MKEYIFLYALFKLNDIKELFNNDYGYSLIIFVILSILFGLKTLGRDKENDPIPFLGFFQYKDRCAEFVSTGRHYMNIVFIIFGLQICMNLISVALPTTGQAVAIITAGKGMQSNTFQTLVDLDPAIAEYLKREVKDFLKSNLVDEK